MSDVSMSDHATVTVGMVIVIMGVSGSGKTTVGRALASAIGGKFYDADDFHPAANIEKMRSGKPLTEEDREPWLRALRNGIDEWLTQAGVSVLACSALTVASRERLGMNGESVRLVYLRGSPELIRSRMRGRQHFMPPELLGTQFATLEPPGNALTLDVDEPVERLVERIRMAWNLA